MGWGHWERYRDGRGVVHQGTRASESWKHIFYDNRMLRPCCYACPYTTTKRSSNITIADYWGLSGTENQAFKDRLGVSLVLANNSEGLEYFRCCNVDLRASSLDEALSGNPMLSHPSSFSGCRKNLWEQFYSHGYESFLKNAGFIEDPLRHFSQMAKLHVKRLLRKA